MSAYSTSSPSIEHTRWYLIRPPSVTCTWRNETSCDSVAAYSFTGTLTSPKDTAPFQMARISYLRVFSWDLASISEQWSERTRSTQPVGYGAHRGGSSGGHSQGEQALEDRRRVRRARLVVDRDCMPAIRPYDGQPTGLRPPRQGLREVVTTIEERDLHVAFDIPEGAREVEHPARGAHRRHIAPVRVLGQP